MDQNRRILIAVVAVLLVASVASLFVREAPQRSAVAAPPVQLSYSAFKRHLEAGEIAAVRLQGRAVSGETTVALEAPGGRTTQGFHTRVPEFGDPDLLQRLEAQDVDVQVLEPADQQGSWLIALLPWLLILAIWYLLWRRMAGLGGRLGGRDIKDFLAGASKTESERAIEVRFADVAGQDNAKSEVAELVSFLRAPDRYTALGAEVPHGVLLMGPPGTGKTLLARAVAGEAGVPFFHISASEFIEVYVGVGASRVRNMFAEAKRRAPCIIFIDELDSVGRVRGTGIGGGHDEREQTLNQILAEMDGFAGHEAVIVLAATNRPDVLDPALLRPGRFDRHVTLELPDITAREAILRVHVSRIPLADDVDLTALAAGTPGFSGADLKNLTNEAAMAAARDGAKAVAQAHFEAMRERILMGTVRTLAIKPEERHRLAVHEAGHTAVAHYLPRADPPHKVTIVPRGRALGGTQQLPEEERYTLTEADLRARLAVLLAGRAAERSLLGSVSSGADDDIRKASQLARAMVGRWGMSEELGPVDVRDSDEHPFLGREIAQPRQFSEATAAAADRAVRQLLTDAEAEAERILQSQQGRVERLVARLEADEALDRAAIVRCLGPRPGQLPAEVSTARA
jgi:cell division protease FtsH